MVFGDVIVFLMAASIASFLRFDAFIIPDDLYFPLVIVGILYFAFMMALRAYTSLDLGVLRMGIVRLTFSLVAAYALFFSLTYFMKSSSEISRLWMGYSLVINLFALSVYRLVFGYILLKIGAVEKMRSRFAVIYSKSCESVKNAIGDATETHRINLTQSIEVCPSGSHEEFETRIKDALDVLRADVPDVLVLALSDADREKFSSVLPAVSAMSAEILEFSPLTADHLKPAGEDITVSPERPAEWVVVAGVPFIRRAKQPLSGRGWWVKRLEDIVLGTLLLVLFSPVMLFAALGVKLTSPGPILYRQLRHGFNGNEIRVLKFRSMHAHSCDADAVGELSQAKKDDPRVTRFGAFLRRHSLDELPQFFNVLKGEMSLVGPRPHSTKQYALYQGKVDTYFSRHRVLPGITGWAQVNGWRGETDTDEKIEQRVAFDLYYIQNWSIWFDIRILFLTLFLGFANKNAF